MAPRTGEKEERRKSKKGRGVKPPVPEKESERLADGCDSSSLQEKVVVPGGPSGVHRGRKELKRVSTRTSRGGKKMVKEGKPESSNKTGEKEKGGANIVIPIAPSGSTNVALGFVKNPHRVVKKRTKMSYPTERHLPPLTTSTDPRASHETRREKESFAHPTSVGLRRQTGAPTHGTSPAPPAPAPQRTPTNTIPRLLPERKGSQKKGATNRLPKRRP